MRASGKNAQDPASKQLQSVSRKMGNQDFSAHMEHNSQQRDQLLAFIAQRLKTLQGVQNTERLEIKDQRQWFKEVAKGDSGYHLPDATRWHDAARRYRRSAEALARGDLSRGAQLLEQALESERTAYNSMPRQVRTELDEQESTAASTPDALPHAIGSGTCPSVALPTEIRTLTSHILRVQDLMKDSPPLPVARDWWEEDLDEEEEEDDEDED